MRFDEGGDEPVFRFLHLANRNDEPRKLEVRTGGDLAPNTNARRVIVAGMKVLPDAMQAPDSCMLVPNAKYCGLAYLLLRLDLNRR